MADSNAGVLDDIGAGNCVLVKQSKLLNEVNYKRKCRDINKSVLRQSSRIFDEQAEDLNYEKRKTDGLLQQLLPVDIIAKLKSGEQPSPRLFITA